MIQVLLVDSDPSAREMAGARLGEEPDLILETSTSPEEALALLRSERFDVIVAHKLDRFSRNLADVVRNVARLKEAGVGLVSVSEPWLDTTTPQGEFMLYLFALLAGTGTWNVR